MALDAIASAFADTGGSPELRELHRKIEQLVQDLNDRLREAESRLAALEARTAADIPYTVAATGDWTTADDPTTVKEALDDIASGLGPV